MPDDTFCMTGEHYRSLSPRFQRIALDAVHQTAMLSWPDRLFFLTAAGDKHEVWRQAYDARYVGEAVPEWTRIINAIIELWEPAPITCFEMAAIYAMSDDRNWRMAGELWCVSRGDDKRLASFWANPVGYAGQLVGEALDRLDQLAS